MPRADAALVALYQPRMRELAARVRGDRRLSRPDVTVAVRSPICGSTLTLESRSDGEVLNEIGWKIRACTLGMASLGCVSLAGPGQSREQIAKVAHNLTQLLHGKEIGFPSPWEELAIFAAAREYPTRFGSIMLPFQAIGQSFAELKRTSSRAPSSDHDSLDRDD